MDETLIDLKIQVIKQGGLYIAYSHAIDLSTTGKSEEQALTAFWKLIKIFLKQLIKSEAERPGAFSQSLIDMGWTKHSKRWAPPVIKSSK